MLYHFLLTFARQFRVLNVLNYISFRAVGAAVTALLLSFAVQAYKRFGTLDPHELAEFKG